MIRRKDLRGTLRAKIPQGLKAACLRFGGTNPFGEPMYRIIRAEDRTIPANGAWMIWAKGLSVDDRSGLGIPQVIDMLRKGKRPQEINEFVESCHERHPLKVHTGMIDRPLYTFKGFIIEKWKPASSFGAPVDWYAYRFLGNAALGAYPVRGEYELVAGPTPYMPTPEQLRQAIRDEMHQIDSRPRNPRERMRFMLEQIDGELKSQLKNALLPIDAMVKEDENILTKTVSLAAGRYRQEIAEKAGIRTHVGN